MDASTLPPASLSPKARTYLWQWQPRQTRMSTSGHFAGIRRVQADVRPTSEIRVTPRHVCLEPMADAWPEISDKAPVVVVGKSLQCSGPIAHESRTVH